MNLINTLETEFKEKIEGLIVDVGFETDRKWIVTSGRRTMAQQRKIYAQGRTTPGSIVSNAPAGSSAHNFGLAADLAPLKEVGTEIDWNADRSLWNTMARIAVDHGLVAGANFRTICDLPHVEDKNWRVQRDKWKNGEITIV